MRFGQTQRLSHSRNLRLQRGLRRLRSRNDTEYLLSDPETAKRLNAALERSLAGLSRPLSLEKLEARLRLAEEA